MEPDAFKGIVVAADLVLDGVGHGLGGDGTIVVVGGFALGNLKFEILVVLGLGGWLAEVFLDFGEFGMILILSRSGSRCVQLDLGLENDFVIGWLELQQGIIIIILIILFPFVIAVIVFGNGTGPDLVLNLLHCRKVRLGVRLHAHLKLGHLLDALPLFREKIFKVPYLLLVLGRRRVSLIVVIAGIESLADGALEVSVVRERVGDHAVDGKEVFQVLVEFVSFLGCA